MIDLRPISLCAVSYKIVSRILITRLKRFLPQLVSETQSAFVAVKLISDNILIAHEMVHALRTNPRCSDGYMVIKADMSKAYDRVEWGFLEEPFKKIGSNETWSGWVMECISSVTYSVILNGKSHGLIKTEMGIRQDDPISPFIFILCAKALVHVMKRTEELKRITCLHISRSDPLIQQLLFTDDSIFVCRSTLKEASEILHCLKLYGEASGQEINFQKSAITFGSKTDPMMKRLMGLYMGITQEGGVGKYLGLPECLSSSKRELLSYITDRLSFRLGGWSEKCLSLGGKEILIKSMAQALPVYAMSCFKLTQHQCRKLTSVVSNFWWNGKDNKRKMHWVSWQKMCKAKSDGGLGFRDVNVFNQALLAKQAWRLISNPNSLVSRLYKSRYFANTNFLTASKGLRPSYAWNIIIFGRILLQKGILRSIGNGRDTAVWRDKWILDSVPRPPSQRGNVIEDTLCVADLLASQGNWILTTLQALFVGSDISKIREIIPYSSMQDEWL